MDPQVCVACMPHLPQTAAYEMGALRVCFVLGCAYLGMAGGSPPHQAYGVKHWQQRGVIELRILLV